MQHKTLGNSDLSVPVVCLGTMTFGHQASEEIAFQLLDYALENGVNFIDTAEMYPVPPAPELVGKTEGIIGRWAYGLGFRVSVSLASQHSQAWSVRRLTDRVSWNRSQLAATCTTSPPKHTLPASC